MVKDSWWYKILKENNSLDYSNTYLSRDEFECFQLKERIPTIELASRLTLSLKNNSRAKVDLDLTPYHKLPLKMVGVPGVLFIYAIAPTQSGKTLLLQIFLADRVDQCPGGFMQIFPTQDSGRILFEEKVISLVEDTPMIARHIVEPRRQTVAATAIKLNHMTIRPAWSNSAASMNSVTCVSGGLDELRLHTVQLSDGGNSVEYLEDRAKTYLSQGKCQFMGVTTPSHEGDLMHMQLDKPGTQELWFMSECTSCGKMQVLDIYENFIYDEVTRIYEPHCMCKFCNAEFNGRNEKRDMNSRGYYGKWEEQGKLREDIDPLEPSHSIVFRWTSEVSPFTSFQHIADKYAKVKDDYAGLTNFNQCWRARFEKQQESTVTMEDLSRRIGKYPRCEVPEWTKVLTAGIDTQGDGFYWCVTAFGSNKRSAIIEYGKISSHHLIDSSEIVRRLLIVNFERKIYQTKKGKKWAIGLWAIDTQGNRASQVYEACLGLQKCVPVKGASMKQDENIRVTKNTPILDELYLVNMYNYLVLTDSVCMSDNFHLPTGTGKGFMRQYCNLRIVKDVKKDKYGNEVKFPQKFGQCDLRIAHNLTEVACDVKMVYGTSFRDDLELKDFEYNPIDNIIINPDEDTGQVRGYAGKQKSSENSKSILGLKDDTYAAADAPMYGSHRDSDDSHTEDYGDFTDSGTIM